VGADNVKPLAEMFLLEEFILVYSLL